MIREVNALTGRTPNYCPFHSKTFVRAFLVYLVILQTYRFYALIEQKCIQTCLFRHTIGPSMLLHIGTSHGTDWDSWREHQPNTAWQPQLWLGHPKAVVRKKVVRHRQRAASP
jgi:hypothetical protein